CPLTEADLPKTLRDVDLSIAGSSPWAVNPGDLRGNLFSIAIRSIDLANYDAESFRPLRAIPNFFGHQRFGTARPNTHKIGRYLVKGDPEGAVREFLAEPYQGEPNFAYDAREALKNNWDLQEALEKFPQGLSYERLMLQRLSINPSMYSEAFNALPKTLLRLFIDSYQSYLFNIALSKRMSTIGLSSIAQGDFVSPLDRWSSPSRAIKVNQGNFGSLQKMIADGRAVPMMRIIGSKTDFGGSEGEIYGHLLESEGVKIGDFGKILGMPFEGTLRGITFTPLQYEAGAIAPDPLNQGKHTISLKTFLPKSCYATVMLREIMRPEDPLAAGF
ncbi:MAG: tRNA pseudouridine(13) synthase TruD, partial [Candidatus Methanomethylicus sp.]|nr:tRNA pseudouridine(13) synthase TruD [Candidatus Methanomethylicus sp.]